MGFRTKTDADRCYKNYDALVKETFEEIGKKYYEDNKDNSDAEYHDDLEKITDYEQKKQLLKQYCLKIDGKRQCEHCGETVPSNSIFCNICGKTLEQLDFSPLESMFSKYSQSQTESQSDVCPSCGHALVAGAVFCEKCGSKVEQKTATANPGTCPSCGKPLVAGAAFCEKCGHKI